MDEKRGVDLMKYNEHGPYEFFQLSQINFIDPFICTYKRSKTLNPTMILEAEGDLLKYDSPS